MLMEGLYIFIVPSGPRLDLRTSCRPSPALMLTLRASPRRCKASWSANPHEQTVEEGQVAAGYSVLLTRLLG